MRLIIDEHRLRERIVTVVREGQQHLSSAAGQAEVSRAAVQHELGGLPALTTDLQIPPADAERQSRPERLRGRLFRREARREMRDGIAPGPAVGNLILGEDAAQEPLVPARDDFTHAWDPYEIDPDAERHWPM